jgi:hypothetical protein
MVLELKAQRMPACDIKLADKLSSNFKQMVGTTCAKQKNAGPAGPFNPVM